MIKSFGRRGCKRGENRSRVVRPGKVLLRFFGRAADVEVLDCTIQNVSRRGAHIRYGGAAALPCHVFLVDVLKGVAYEATVAWQRPPNSGLVFSQRLNIDEKLPPELLRIVEIWNEARQMAATT